MKTQIDGIAAPLMIANLDTDQIMPKQFLKILGKEGLEGGVLHDLRFTPEGKPRPDFVLHRPGYAGARILIAGPNFGCGSSREHAVWGLQRLGIEAVIASSFGEIFYGNALNNGLLPVMLDEEAVAALAGEASDAARNRICIDLIQCVVRTAGGTAYPFTLASRYRTMIVEGLDMVEATLRLQPEIEHFERAHISRAPWLQAQTQLP